jgi:hypothetical protein
MAACETETYIRMIKQTSSLLARIPKFLDNYFFLYMTVENKQQLVCTFLDKNTHNMKLVTIIAV